MLPSPLPLGPFVVEPNGALRLGGAGKSAQFSFRAHGMRVASVIGPDGLRLQAVLARLPSSAKLGAAGAASARQASITVLRRLQTELAPGFALQLTPDHAIALHQQAPLGFPATIAALLLPLLRFAQVQRDCARALNAAGCVTPRG